MQNTLCIKLHSHFTAIIPTFWDTQISSKILRILHAIAVIAFHIVTLGIPLFIHYILNQNYCYSSSRMISSSASLTKEDYSQNMLSYLLTCSDQFSETPWHQYQQLLIHRIPLLHHFGSTYYEDSQTKPVNIQLLVTYAFKEPSTWALESFMSSFLVKFLQEADLLAPVSIRELAHENHLYLQDNPILRKPYLEYIGDFHYSPGILYAFLRHYLPLISSLEQYKKSASFFLDYEKSCIIPSIKLLTPYPEDNDLFERTASQLQHSLEKRIILKTIYQEIVLNISLYNSALHNGCPLTLQNFFQAYLNQIHLTIYTFFNDINEQYTLLAMYASPETYFLEEYTSIVSDPHYISFIDQLLIKDLPPPQQFFLYLQTFPNIRKSSTSLDNWYQLAFTLHQYAELSLNKFTQRNKQFIKIFLNKLPNIFSINTTTTSLKEALKDYIKMNLI